MLFFQGNTFYLAFIFCVTQYIEIFNGHLCNPNPWYILWTINYRIKWKNSNWLIELHDVLMVNSIRIHIVIKCCWWLEYIESCFPDNSILIASQYVSFSKLFFLCIKLFEPLYPISPTIHLLSFLVLEQMTDSNAEKFKAYVNFIIIIISYILDIHSKT